MVMFWIGGITSNIAKVLNAMSIELRTASAVLKATSIMKRASVLHSIILKAMHVQWCVRMIGSRSLARWLLITSAEYTSLKELVAMAHGIRPMIIDIIQMALIVSIIDLLMIYSGNADQLQNNNTMIKV